MGGIKETWNNLYAMKDLISGISSGKISWAQLKRMGIDTIKGDIRYVYYNRNIIFDNKTYSRSAITSYGKRLAGAYAEVMNIGETIFAGGESAKSIIGRLKGTPKAINIPSEFADQKLLDEHFYKHKGEFKGVYKNSDDYLQGARNVIAGGTKVQYEYTLKNGTVETRIGYVKYMGNTKKGELKFEFVGTNKDGKITTYHVKRGEDLWKLLNG